LAVRPGSQVHVVPTRLGQGKDYFDEMFRDLTRETLYTQSRPQSSPTDRPASAARDRPPSAVRERPSSAARERAISAARDRAGSDLEMDRCVNNHIFCKHVEDLFI